MNTTRFWRPSLLLFETQVGHLIDSVSTSIGPGFYAGEATQLDEGTGKIAIMH